MYTSSDCHIEFSSQPTRLFSSVPLFLTMYNMQHGDAFLINDQNFSQGLLIDCGAQHPNDAYVKSAKIQLEKDIQKVGSMSFLISHFHRDHFNMLRRLKKFPIKDLYIANVISPQDISVMLLVLKIFSKKSPIFQKVLNYLKFIPKLVNYLTNNSQIHFISYGYTISNLLGSYDVLWPQFSHSFPKDFSLENDDFYREFVENDSFKKVQEGLSSIFSNAKERENEKVIFLSEYSNIQKDSRSTLRALREYLGEEIDFSLRFSEEQIAKEIEKLTPIGNETSIVLFEKDKKILFTGDIDPDVYSNFIAKNLIPHVHILKTAHHGSISGYSPLYPTSDITLINEMGNGPFIDWAHYKPPFDLQVFAFEPVPSTIPLATTFIPQFHRFLI